MGRAMGVTNVKRIGPLPLWRWTTVRHGKVVAGGFAPTEKGAWNRSIRKVARS